MQKAVAVAFGSEGHHLHLLQHHHQHNEKDGKCRACYADGTDDGLLTKLRQRLCKIMLNHSSTSYL